MIAREIGDRVYERNYDEPASRKAVQTEAQFNYDKEMRETRRNVDSLLAAGKTGEAEKYMEDRRIDFNRQGYTIRKLNQAYFAFHGIYGQDPGAISPVYQNMLELRKNYASLAGFVDKMAVMISYADLERSVSSPVN
jgi:cell division protein FtsI/penicillin-binding protein 2